MQVENEQSTLLSGGPTNESSVDKPDQYKGARPKIRNPKEAKRRRFVMKQAKTISKPLQLESVSESEEGQTPLLIKQNQEDDRKGTEFFGVRSYVHTFYEAMALDNTQDIAENTFGYVIPIQKRRKEILCWRLMVAFGVLILLMGIIVLLVGFFVPKRKEVVDTQEDLQIIDREDQAFNRDLDVCKIVGTVLFCTGGLLLSALLLAINWIWRDKSEDPFAIPLVDAPSSNVADKVPATEAVAAVQPKREDSCEVIMTNAGLCKVP